MDALTFGRFIVTNKHVESGPSFITSVLRVLDEEEGRMIEVKHFQFIGFKAGTSE